MDENIFNKEPLSDEAKQPENPQQPDEPQQLENLQQPDESQQPNDNDFQQPDEPQQPENLQQPDEPSAKNSKKKYLILGAAAAVIALAVCVGGFMFGKGTHSGGNASKKLTLTAWFDEDGKGYIVKEGGAVTEFEAAENASAKMTPDRKHIVLNDSDGVTILNAKGEKIVQKSASDLASALQIWVLNNSAAVFSSSDQDDVETIKQRTFDDYNKEHASAKITEKEFYDYYDERFANTVSDAKDCYKTNLHKEYDDVYPAEYKLYYCAYDTGNITLLNDSAELYDTRLASDSDVLYYATAEGLYTYNASKKEPEKIQDVQQTELEILYAADSGDSVVWADIGSETADIYTYSGSGAAKLGVLDKTESLSAFRIGSTDRILCMADACESMLYGDMTTGDAETIQLKAPLSSIYSIYDAYGRTYLTTRTTDGIYTFLGEFGKEGLYYISFETGEREKVSSDVDSIAAITAGKILYIDENDTLKLASLDKENMGDPEKIASDVYYAWASDVSSAYYYKNVEDYSTGDLYFWNGSDSEKIDTDVKVWETTLNDQGTYLYETGEKELTDSCSYATFHLAKGTDSTKVSDDILRSMFFSNDNDMNDFCLLKYDHTDEDGHIFANIVYYDGKKATKVVSEVLYR